MSSEDLLVSSLEYLLEEDETEAPEAEDAEAREGLDEENRIASEVESAAAEEPAGEVIMVYYGNGSSDELRQESVTVESVTPEEIVGALARHNILSLDTTVISFEQREEEGGLTLYLDLSGAAGEYLRTMSEEAESVIVSSIINTFLDNYKAAAICLTVEGEPVELSGRAYETPFVRCTPTELMESLREADEENAESGESRQP